jgi:hypothetical protein
MASVPVGGQRIDEEGLQHVSVEMDIPNVAGSAPALLTLPAGTGNGAITPECRSLGVVLAHGDDAAGWQSELMNTVALVRSHHELSSKSCR